jgi:hypothetical protein
MKKTIYILIVAVSVLLVRCTEDYNVTLDSTYTRLVVDGAITTDTTAHMVHLAKSADYFYNQSLVPVSGAQVTISDEEQTYTLAESVDAPGYYYTDSDVYGIEYHTYTLTIKNVDIDGDGTTETYTASCKLYPVTKPDSITVKAVDDTYYDYEIRFFGQDPADIADYYMFRVQRNGTMLSDTLSEVTISNDKAYNGEYIKNLSVYYLYEGKTDENIVAGDTIILEMCDITKEYYTFIYDVMQESAGSNPFGGQPANVSTNIEDDTKATGFFAAYSISRVSYIVKQEDLEP